MDEEKIKRADPKTRLFKDQKTGFAITIVYLGFIYGTLGIARTVQQTLNKAGFEPFFFQCLFVLSIVITGYLLVAFRVKGLSNYLCLAVLIFTFYWLFKEVIATPVEKLHFIQYGLLTFLVFYTLQFSIRDRFLYFWTAMAVFGAGCLDESIQFYLPDRVYDPRDIVINGVAGILTLIFIGFVLKEE